MTTGERLDRYGAFDDDIVASVADVAAEQNRHGFRELADRYGMADGPQRTQPLMNSHSNHTMEYLRFEPAQDYDETKARILYAPMAIPVDENMTMRALRLFAADPSEQLFVIGSPAHVGNHANRPPITSLPRIAKGDFTPQALPLLAHFRHELPHIDTVDALGYSYGADVAAAFGALAVNREYDVQVARGVWAEPASLTRRPVKQLLDDFMRSGEQLDAYVQAADSRPLDEARELADSGLARYIGGLSRLSNLAIVKALAHNGFARRAAESLSKNPDLRATLVWGTASEITDATVAERTAASLSSLYQNRVGGLAIEGMHHAGGDDIDLHAAIMLQGLRSATA